MIQKTIYLSGLVLLFCLLPLTNYAQYAERSKLVTNFKENNDLIVSYVNYGAYNYIGCSVWDNTGRIYDLPVKKIHATVSQDGNRIISDEVIFQTSKYEGFVKIAVSFWKDKIPDHNHPLGYVMKRMGYCREITQTPNGWRARKCSF